MALHLPIQPLKTYRDVNLVPTSSLADDIATAPSASVLIVITTNNCPLMMMSLTAKVCVQNNGRKSQLNVSTKMKSKSLNSSIPFLAEAINVLQ